MIHPFFMSLDYHKGMTSLVAGIGGAETTVRMTRAQATIQAISLDIGFHYVLIIEVVCTYVSNYFSFIHTLIDLNNGFTVTQDHSRPNLTGNVHIIAIHDYSPIRICLEALDDQIDV